MTDKSFSEMTQAEINAMSQEEFLAVPSEEKRSCYDCKHLISALSWWCSNEDAIQARGTKIPGCIKCTYWEPIEQTVYIPIGKRVKEFFNKILKSWKIK